MKVVAGPGSAPRRGSPLPLPDSRRGLAIATAKIPVRQVLDRYDIVPRKRFGQNFLHDPAVGRRIVDVARVGAGDAVLEVGPGLGALTIPLLETGANVVAVEVDERIATYLEDTLGDRPNFELVRGDVLGLDLAALLPGPATLVANLPYSITGPMLALLLENADRFPRAVIMVQKEVGTRLVAGAGGKEIGAPAVLLRLLYRVRRRFDVGKGAFLPPPEIVSAVIEFERLPGTTLDPFLRDAVNTAYRHRRKMIRKTLKGIVAAEAAIGGALAGLGHPDTARPEDLEPEDWPRLLSAVRGGTP